MKTQKITIETKSLGITHKKTAKDGVPLDSVQAYTEERFLAGHYDRASILIDGKMVCEFEA